MSLVATLKRSGAFMGSPYALPRRGFTAAGHSHPSLFTNKYGISHLAPPVYSPGWGLSEEEEEEDFFFLGLSVAVGG